MSKLYHAGRMQFLRIIITLIRDAIFLPRDDELIVRTLTKSAMERLYLPTRHTNETHTVISLLPYKNRSVRACVRETKFGNNFQSAELLGHVLGMFLLHTFDIQHGEGAHEIIIIPLPLSKERLRDRGFNQVERIVRSTRLNLPAYSVRTDILFRIRDTKPQTSLSAADRQQNLKGAFIAKTVHGDHTYMLVDDVVTTGSTMRAATQALLGAGAQRIYCIALAH